MSSIIEIGTTIVAIKAIQSGGETRRSAERKACRELVAELIGKPNIEINHTPDGAPYIDGSNSNVSISHSRNLAAVALDPAATTGIDIEEAREEQLKNVAPRILSHDELTYYQSIPNGLLIAWTLKEALYKAAGNIGADFRRDIILPTSASEKKASVASTEGYAKGFDIVFCNRIDIDGRIGWLSVVRLIP